MLLYAIGEFIKCTCGCKNMGEILEVEMEGYLVYDKTSKGWDKTRYIPTDLARTLTKLEKVLK
jgi:hypothetical protein